VFTDKDDIVLKYENANNMGRIYIETTVPEQAKYLYVFSYGRISQLILRYSSIDNLSVAKNAILETQKGKYDKDFIYVAYSEIPQNGYEINTK